MDNIARVRQEIERRRDFLYERYIKKGRGCIEESRYDECVEILSFLDTLSEEPDKSLEEAAEEYTQKMLESWRFDSTGCRPPRESFKARAEWQKSQMLKDAVEGDVMLTLHDKTGDISLHTGYLPKELGIKCDDKVRIIVLKDNEDESK